MWLLFNHFMYVLWLFISKTNIWVYACLAPPRSTRLATAMTEGYRPILSICRKQLQTDRDHLIILKELLQYIFPRNADDSLGSEGNFQKASWDLWKMYTCRRDFTKKNCQIFSLFQNNSGFEGNDCAAAILYSLWVELLFVFARWPICLNLKCTKIVNGLNASCFI